MQPLRKIDAKHGVIASYPKTHYFGYFGWPSVTQKKDGTLIVGASGLRHAHVCPYGKTVLFTSRDQGQTWSAPNIINDSPMDDRDVGLVRLNDDSILASWFTLDTKSYMASGRHRSEDPKIIEELAYWDQESIEHFCGSFVSKSVDGYGFGPRIRVNVSAPHGPIVLSDQSLLYVGKVFSGAHDSSVKEIEVHRSTDDGNSFQKISNPDLSPYDVRHCHEPHAVETDDGRIIAMVRYQKDDFTFFQIESTDGGCSWSKPMATGAIGSPPHIVKHSSGALIVTYGYRGHPKVGKDGPFGQLAMISRDHGRTWSDPFAIRLDGQNHDLGYPCSVELPNGDLFTVYYQQHSENEWPGLLFSRWALPY